MATRKDIYFRNRYWNRVQGGCYCDNCNHLIIGDLRAYKHKETAVRLCQDCYRAGVTVKEIIEVLEK